MNDNDTKPSKHRAPIVVRLSHALIAAATLVTVFFAFPATPALAYAYNGSAGVAYAQKWEHSYNAAYWNYNSSGGDCTNFASQVFHAGGIPFDTTGANKWQGGMSFMDEWNDYDSGSWMRVRDFRSYWYTFGHTYIHIEGRTALTAAYTPAGLGEAYVFDAGTSSSADNWEHTAIEDNWNGGHDWEIQHSIGEIVDWRKWYYTRTAAEKVNMDKPGHGIRVIGP
jgi:hypothetical protein